MASHGLVCSDNTLLCFSHRPILMVFPISSCDLQIEPSRRAKTRVKPFCLGPHHRERQTWNLAASTSPKYFGSFCEQSPLKKRKKNEAFLSSQLDPKNFQVSFVLTSSFLIFFFLPCFFSGFHTYPKVFFRNTLLDSLVVNANQIVKLSLSNLGLDITWCVSFYLSIILLWSLGFSNVLVLSQKRRVWSKSRTSHEKSKVLLKINS